MVRRGKRVLKGGGGWRERRRTDAMPNLQQRFPTLPAGPPQGGLPALAERYSAQFGTKS